MQTDINNKATFSDKDGFNSYTTSSVTLMATQW